MLLAILVFLSAVPFLLLFSLLIWMLLEVLKSKFNKPYWKVIWLLILTFLPVIGMVIYVILGRKSRIRVEKIK
jgi:hypothetical protein